MPKSTLASRKQQWSILGAGSIGCLWAAYLGKANYPVRLLLKDQQTKKVWEAGEGLSLDLHSQIEPFCTNIINPVDACLVDEVDSPIDFLLVTTKAHQTLAAIQSLKPKLNDNTTILLMQNGLGVFEELRTELPLATILCASTTEGAYQTDRFHVIHAGQGSTHLGSFEPSNTNIELLNAIKNNLSSTALKVEFDEHIEKRLWNKLAINCAINALTVIHQCQNGKLLSIPEAKKRMVRVCEEVAAVMIKKGISSEKDSTTGAKLFNIVEAVAVATRHNYSSMLQDFTHQRITEIDYINGYLIRQAKHLRIPCPYNIELVEQVIQLTRY